MLREPKPCGIGAILGGTCALAACSVAPPTGPSVMALPPQGKSLTAFQQEDGYCRNYAGIRIGTFQPVQAGTQAASVGATNAYADPFDLQQRYDIAYTQCLYSYGDTVEPPPATYQAYASPFPYWSPWYGWYGPRLFGGDVLVFRGSNFHHFHHSHR